MQAEYKIIGADGREYGPATLDELIEWVREGRVGRQTQVWSSTDERWTPAGRMTELAAWIGAMPDHSTPVEIAPAGFWLRFAAFWVDQVLIAIVVFLIVGVPDMGEGDAFDIEAVKAWTRETQPWVFGISAVYYILTTWLAAATPGKRLLGMRVVRTDDSPVGLIESTLRFLGSAVSQMVLFAGHLFVAFRADKRALHDLLAGTRVVRLKQPAPTSSARG